MSTSTRDITKYANEYKEFNSVDALLSSDESDSGLYGIRHRAGLYTDVLYWNQHADVTIVCFNGAPINGVRPSYNGTSVFNSWKLSKKANFIFVHDATLYLDEKLTLAWYAGSASFSYPPQLEIILRHFIELNDPDHLIFFGISGGGHAALNYSARFPGSIAVAGNPQTNVDNYSDWAKQRYYELCWSLPGSPGQSEDAQPVFDMNAVYAAGTDNFVYSLVNIDDHRHVVDHLVPFVEAARNSLNVRTLLRYWGRGHASCPPHYLLEFFDELVRRRKDGEVFPDVRGARLLESEDDIHAVIEHQKPPVTHTLFDGHLSRVPEVTLHLPARAAETVEVLACGEWQPASPVSASIEIILDQQSDNRYVYGLRPTPGGYEAPLVYKPGKQAVLRTYLPADLTVRALRLRFPREETFSLSNVQLVSYGHPVEPKQEPGVGQTRNDAALSIGTQRNISPSEDVLTVDLEELAGLDPAVLTLDTPVRVNVTTASCVIPLLVVHRAIANRAVILSNGAVDLDRSERAPIFQRSTWWKDIDGHQIFICDPGTVGPNALSLNWGQLSSDYWAVPDMSRAVRTLAKLMGVSEPERRLYFGSSVGGFMSLALCHYDPGARALVNNAQFDWTRWMSGAVNALRAARFNNVLPAAIRERWPKRTSVLRLLETGNIAARVDYLVNMGSSHDRAVDYPEVQNFMDKNPELATHIRVFEYRDEISGHNPLSKDLTIACINGDVANLELPGV